MFHQFYGRVITPLRNWRWRCLENVKVAADKQGLGVGSLPAVSNRIMEIRRRRSVRLSFGGRSVLNHLRLGLLQDPGARSHFVRTDHLLTTTSVKTSGRLNAQLISSFLGRENTHIFILCWPSFVEVFKSPLKKFLRSNFFIMTFEIGDNLSHKDEILNRNRSLSLRL